MANINLKEKERIDDLHINNYKIIQNPELFCFGMDAVLLSGFVDPNVEGKALDLGTGTGIIPILIEAKTKISHIVGLELQKESVDMAKRSMVLNQLSSKIEILEGDIKVADNLLERSSFDVITSNPPYMINHTGLKNTNLQKTIARHELYCTLEDVIRAASRLAKVGGRFYMVHRPNRLVEIMVLLQKYKLEPKKLRFVHPYKDKEPNMILVESVRHGKPMLKIEPPLIVYEQTGKYTEEIYEIYGMNKS